MRSAWLGISLHPCRFLFQRISDQLTNLSASETSRVFRRRQFAWRWRIWPYKSYKAIGPDNVCSWRKTSWNIRTTYKISQSISIRSLNTNPHVDSSSYRSYNEVVLNFRIPLSVLWSTRENSCYAVANNSSQVVRKILRCHWHSPLDWLRIKLDRKMFSFEGFPIAEFDLVPRQWIFISCTVATFPMGASSTISLFLVYYPRESGIGYFGIYEIYKRYSRRWHRCFCSCATLSMPRCCSYRTDVGYTYHLYSEINPDRRQGPTSAPISAIM
jgi:hypothetical protein